MTLSCPWLLACLLVSAAVPAASGVDTNSPRAGRPRGVLGSSFELRDGGIVRGPLDQKRIALTFTGHSYAEGGEVILNELRRHRAKGSFFLTGDFLANTNFSPLIRRLVEEGHYLGPHSDKHLLYCAWDDRRTLVTREQFAADLRDNLRKVELFGIRGSSVHYFLPAFEHYNAEIARWTEAEGHTLVNYTPGTRSNADYTGEAEKNFVPSQKIFDSILQKERMDPNGLNGFILLLHIGAGPGRADKFHARFGELLDALTAKGYQFVRVDELLSP